MAVTEPMPKKQKKSNAVEVGENDGPAPAESASMFKKSDWKIDDQCHNPKQENGYDCGVFLILFMDMLMLSLPLMFGSDDISLTRKKLTMVLLRRKEASVQPINIV